jgi:hypothetical protein
MQANAADTTGGWNQSDTGQTGIAVKSVFTNGLWEDRPTFPATAFRINGNSPGAAAPEPGTLVLLGLCGPLTLLRLRRKHKGSVETFSRIPQPGDFCDNAINNRLC